MMEDLHFDIRKTEDGSDTLYSQVLQESYHSLHGAINESMHVFIEAGLRQVSLPRVRIFEVGFGTGLNALLSLREAEDKGFRVFYETVEAYPLEEKTAASLNYGSFAEPYFQTKFIQLHTCEWEQSVEITESFTLLKHHCNFCEWEAASVYDLIYYDAFSPDKQPEMWEEELIQRLAAAMAPGGILVTYCAKGEIRRRLQRCGLTVERLPGPAGKREMLRAVKL